MMKSRPNIEVKGQGAMKIKDRLGSFYIKVLMGKQWGLESWDRDIWVDKPEKPEPHILQNP